jgi:hypothetical protein
MNKITSEVSAKKEQYGSIVATVQDKHGNIKQRVEQPVDSFNNQFWRMFFKFSVGAGTTNAILNNTLLSGSTTTTVIFGTERADGITNQYKGIVLGSGTSQTAINTAVMGTLIEFSSVNTDTGKLNALQNTIEFDDATGIATISRSFVNLVPSSTVSVNEIGVANTNEPSNLNIGVSILTVRDVLDSTLNVAFEDTLSIQYKIRMFNGTNNLTNICILGNYGRYTGNTYTPFVNTTGSLLNVRGTMLSTSSGFTTNEGNVRQGLIFGTGNTAFSKTQIDLVGSIHHGNSAGQLFYHPANFTSYNENTATNSLSWTIVRPVENRSGSDITISEVGLFTSAGTSTNSRFLMDRKVLSNAVTVTNGNTVTFTWEFCYTV